MKDQPREATNQPEKVTLVKGRPSFPLFRPARRDSLDDGPLTLAPPSSGAFMAPTPPFKAAWGAYLGVGVARYPAGEIGL